MSDITLTISQQDTLRELRNASSQASTTSNALNTGRKVNGVTDDAVAYFRSQSLSDRASALTTVKANIGQSVQSVQAALDATSAVEGLLELLKGVLESARGATLSQRVSATTQFKSISRQLGQLVRDASYQGLNLLTSSSANLTTQFSERTAASLSIDGYDLTATSVSSRSLFTQAAVFNVGGDLIFSALVNDAVDGNGGGSGSGGGGVLYIKSGSAISLGFGVPVPYSTVGYQDETDGAGYEEISGKSDLVIPQGSVLIGPQNQEVYLNAYTFSSFSVLDVGDIQQINSELESYNISDSALINSSTGDPRYSGSFDFYLSTVFSQSVPQGGAANGFSALNILGGASTGGDANTTLRASIVAAIYSRTDNRLDAAISQIQAISGSLGINVDILKTRTSFTSGYSTTLQQASDKLTLADLNEEAANSQALALRQQIGVQSLSASGQQNASILDLLR